MRSLYFHSIYYYIFTVYIKTEDPQHGLLRWLCGKEAACHAGEVGPIPGSGRSPGEGNGNPLQYSCLENSMDRGAWRATVHGVALEWLNNNNYPQHAFQIQWKSIRSYLCTSVTQTQAFVLFRCLSIQKAKGSITWLLLNSLCELCGWIFSSAGQLFVLGSGEKNGLNCWGFHRFFQIA